MGGREVGSPMLEQPCSDVLQWCLVGFREKGPNTDRLQGWGLCLTTARGGGMGQVCVCGAEGCVGL